MDFSSIVQGDFFLMNKPLEGIGYGIQQVYRAGTGKPPSSQRPGLRPLISLHSTVPGYKTHPASLSGSAIRPRTTAEAAPVKPTNPRAIAKPNKTNRKYRNKTHRSLPIMIHQKRTIEATVRRAHCPCFSNCSCFFGCHPRRDLLLPLLLHLPL